MTKNKQQLRAEAVERLRGITLDPDGNSHARLSAICGAIRRPAYAWTRGACENVVRTLIDLLTDDDAVDDCGQIADMSQKGGDRVRSEGENVRETPIFTENPQISPGRERECAPDDTREKLEADIVRMLKENDLYWLRAHVEGWLDRQAAITESECLIRSKQGADALYVIENAELQDKLDELTAENDALREWKACYKQAKDDSDHWQRMVGELRDRVHELENELANMTGSRDHWRRVASKHAGEIQKLRAEVVQRAQDCGERFTAMPKGVVWPHFEDGACVNVGDGFVGCDGEPHELACVKFLGDGYWMMEDKRDGGGHFDGFTSLGCGFWSYGETFKRPPVLASDGQPIEVGQQLVGEDGEWWLVERIDRSNAKYPVIGEHGGKTRALKPEWLSHELPDSFNAIAGELREFVDTHLISMGNGMYEEYDELTELAERIEKLAKEDGESCL